MRVTGCFGAKVTVNTCDLLQAWRYKTVVHVPPAPMATTDRSSPGRRLLRLLWQQLDAKVKELVEVRPGWSELEIVRERSAVRLRGSGVWLRMRLRAMLGLASCMGGRSG